ncbi:MAG TPA: carboxypeptidase regulatory-like domain-containing protein [Kofleriaceae bacterium]
MKKLGLGVGVIVLAIAAWLLLGHERSGASDHATGSGSTTASSKLDRAKPSVPAQVSGTVMDADKHTPIAGAVVALANNGAIGGELGVKKPTLTAISDANGVWSAASVPPGAYVITASAINYLPTTITGKVVVASGEPMSGVAIVLHTGGTLVHGTVTDIGGGVIEGAHVRFVDEERFVLSAGEYLAITGKDGTYQISMPEGRWGGQASHEDYVARTEQVEVADKPVKLDFQLIPGGGVRGEVIARDTGKPVPGAMVAAKPQRERFGNNLPNTAADADGVFAIHGLSSGVVALTAFGRGYASAEPTTVELGIGEQLEHVRVLVDRAYTISGTVTAKGTQTGVAGISLGVFSMAQGAQIVAPNPTDDRGRFAIDGVKPGSYMLFAIGEGSVPNIGKQVQVVDKDVEVDLELERGVTLSGHVEPPQAAVMSIEMQGQVGLANMFEAVKTMMVSGDANAQTGEFTLHNVPGGAFKLVAHGKAGPTGELPIVVTDHDQSGLVVNSTIAARSVVA